jgi:hypothetical protein
MLGVAAVLLISGCRESPTAGQTPQTGGQTVPAGPASQGATPATDTPRTVTIEESTPWRHQTLHLNRPTAPLRAHGTDALRETPVAFDYRADEVRMLVHDREGTHERTGHLVSYRLYSTDPALAFEWYYVGRHSPWRFRLALDNAGVPDLGWSVGPVVLLAPLTAPRDFQTALNSSGMVDTATGVEAAPGFVAVPALALAGTRPFLGSDQTAFDITVLAVTNSNDGGMEVEVQGAKPGRTFTFVSPDGKQWSLKGGAPPASAQSPASAPPATPAK